MADEDDPLEEDSQEKDFYSALKEDLETMLRDMSFSGINNKSIKQIAEFSALMVCDVDEERDLHTICFAENLKGSPEYHCTLEYEINKMRGTQNLMLAAGYTSNEFDPECFVDTQFYLEKSLHHFNSAIAILGDIRLNRDFKYDWDDEVVEDETDFCASLIENLNIYKALLERYTESIFHKGTEEDEDSSSDDEDCGADDRNIADENSSPKTASAAQDPSNKDKSEKGKVSFEEMYDLMGDMYHPSAKDLAQIRRYRDMMTSESFRDLIGALRKEDKESAVSAIYKICLSTSNSRLRFGNGHMFAEYPFKMHRNSTYNVIRHFVSAKARGCLDLFDMYYAAAKQRHASSMRLYRSEEKS